MAEDTDPPDLPPADDQPASEDDDTVVDPDREAILRRRRRFVAVALSGLASASLSGCADPKPCLDVAPQACLMVVAEEEDGGTSATSEMGPMLPADPHEVTPRGGDVDEELDGGAAPQACLRVAPQPCLKVAPEPQPCLDIAPPEPDDSSET